MLSEIEPGSNGASPAEAVAATPAGPPDAATRGGKTPASAKLNKKGS